MTIRKIRLSTLSAILALTGLTLFLSISQKARAVSMKINIKDLPEHGLKLIGPTHPSFQGKLSAMLKDKRDPLADALMPYAVLLENEGKKAIVGYRLKWEMTRPDGTVSVRQAGGINPGALMDEGPLGPDHPSLADGFAVKPHSTAFVSLASSLGGDYSGTVTGYAEGSPDSAALDELRLAAKEKRLPSVEDAVIADLQNYKSMTVSFDGVFFEDGTFIGPDTTGFFATVEAYVNAKRDLLQEINFAVGRNRSLDEIFSYIEELASSPLPDRKLSQADLYNLYKKMYAEEALRMRAVSNGRRAVEIELQQYQKKWPKLKKL